MRNIIQTALEKCKVAIGYTIVLSLAINLLMLTVPLYMLQLFDRVIASQSSDTLIFLTIIAIVALGVMAILDIVRNRIGARIGNWFDHEVSPASLQQSVTHHLWGNHYSKQSLVDVMQLRQFISSPTFFVVFDAPWIVVYLLVIYLLSVSLGVIATVGAILLIILAVLNESLVRKNMKQNQKDQSATQTLIENTFNNAEVVQAMGMVDDIERHYHHLNKTAGDSRLAMSDRSNTISSTAKVIRLILQVLMLGAGAYLVIQGELSAGSMIAGSIIMARAMQPIEQGISGWKSMVNSWSAFKRLKQFFQSSPEQHEALEVKKLRGILQVEHLAFAATKQTPRILQGITFTLTNGHGVAVIGPTGAGKSTLARLILGIWPPSLGNVRLDNIETFQLGQKALNLNIGYLPQEPAYFNNSIKHNISRYGQPDEQAIIKAAKAVNIHEAILKLPHGYNTVMGGYELSAGFKQRIALARAFYNDPCLIVLDEPENQLDNDGLVSLHRAIEAGKKQGTSFIIITHRPQLGQLCEHTLVLSHGTCQRYAKTSEVMQPPQGGKHE
ncbi:MAG: type I secretion system permease/ATPase [Coxiellaceae bacterium]|nr:type I secretion system permease/ATPase [Coxiellaceae bacterium]